MKRFAWLGILVGLLACGAQAAPFGPVQYSALPASCSGGVGYTSATGAFGCVTIPNLATALPSATTSQIYGGTGSAGAAQAITLGTGLSITGTTLNATGGSGGVSQIIAGTNVTISPSGGTGAVTINASGGGGSGLVTVQQKTAAYTATSSDCGTQIVDTVSNTVAITFPAVLPIGCQIGVVQGGSARLFLGAGSGATLQNAHSYTGTAAQYAAVSAQVIANSGGSAASMILTGDGSSVPNPASYAGPGDLVSGAQAWFGLRAYSLAYAASLGNAVQVRRASDNTTANIPVLASGSLNVATATTFAGTDATCTATIAGTTLSVSACASGTLHVNDPISGVGITQPAYISAIGTCASPPGTCTLNAAQTVSTAETVTAQVALFVPEVYDQSGNGRNATQATASLQPQLLPICVSGNPCLSYVGSGQTLLWTVPALSTSTITAVAERNGQFTTQSSIIFTPSPNYTQLSFYAPANTIEVYNGVTFSAAQTDSVFHSFIAAINTMAVDGVSTGGLSNMNITGGTATLGAATAGSAALSAFITEVGVWSSTFTSANVTAVCHNQTSFWGMSGSC